MDKEVQDCADCGEEFHPQHSDDMFCRTCERKQKQRKTGMKKQKRTKRMLLRDHGE